MSVLLKRIIFGYIFVLFSYWFLSKDIDYSDLALFIRRVFPTFFLVAIPLYFLPTQSVIPIILCGLLNMVTFPLLNYLTNHKQNISFSFTYDFVFGLYIIIFLASLQLLLQFFLPESLLVAILILLEFIIVILALAEILYYCYYGENISLYAILAILRTHRQEVKEYLKTVYFYYYLLSGCMFIGVFAIIAYYNYLFVGRIEVPIKIRFLFLAICLFSGYYMWFMGNKGLYRRTGLYVMYKDAKEYYDKSKVFQINYAEKYEDLQVKSALEITKSGTIIVVIGESANRLHMPVFSDYDRETTPWLSAQKDNPDFFLFPNAYSTWAQTVPTLEMALTEKNQYNEKSFSEAYSFIDIAKKIGFKTWWYSNQGYMGNDDTQISLVAATTDNSRWVLQDYSALQHDEVLLDYLKRVNSDGKNFVVLHLKGSHSIFRNRYPEQFAKWEKSEKQKIVDEYDNSICYTDFVLSKIYEYAKKNLNLQAMLYFSDHGVEVKEKRMPGFIGFENLRIPFFAYLSEDYRKKFPETAKALESHKNAYFTNDLVYDLVCGILQIKSTHYDARFDISSPLYNFTKNNLQTNLGKTSLEDDNYKRSFEF
jgi:heptose-I-phosphate ethanolaminephosphotransferase